MKPREDDEWHRSYAGVPTDPVESLPRDCLIEWLRFEVETETFDRTLPGFWMPHATDVWLPFDMTLSRRFAAVKRDATIDKLRSVGHAIDTWRDARRYAAGLSFARQKELLAHLLAASPKHEDRVPDEPLTYRNPRTPRST